MSVPAPRTFRNPVRVCFGAGALGSLAELAAGRRCVIVTSDGMARRGTLAQVQEALGGLVAGRYTAVTPNPTVLSCTEAFAAVRGARFDLIVGLGGGSVLDTAKAVAAQCAGGSKDGWLSSHLREGVPFPAAFEPPPILAIPTTAGTGSEVTMWGTVWDEKTGKKYSIAHPRLYPETALIDPALTLSMPPATTVATALDALSHAMEAVWNRSSDPVSDALAVRAVAVIPGALKRVLASPSDLAAREDLMSASLLAGLASSHTRTALAHSISYPLTSELGLAHGMACSLTLPEILREVGRTFPERARLLVDALGAADADAASRTLYELFRAAGVAAELKRHVAGVDALAALRGSFIAPGRAENCLLPADQASAGLLLRKAYESVCGP